MYGMLLAAVDVQNERKRVKEREKVACSFEIEEFAIQRKFIFIILLIPLTNTIF